MASCRRSAKMASVLAIILTCACVSRHGCVPDVLESVISVCARRGCVNVHTPAELLQKCVSWTCRAASTGPEQCVREMAPPQAAASFES